jgi:hypothetical protein
MRLRIFQKANAGIFRAEIITIPRRIAFARVVQKYLNKISGPLLDA